MNKSTDSESTTTRRSFVYRLIGLVSLAPLPLATARGTEQAEVILQPATANQQIFMQRAFAMRDLARQNGDQAYGAILVKNNRIVGQAPSRVITDQDPTGHAEMEAIRNTAQRLGNRNLSGCTMYSSSRPCPMCEAAAYWAGIDQLLYGTEISDGGPPRLSRC